ncbi:MAG: hypothetical protein U0165_14130 [Polyangiaceae bacterium]
MRSPSSFLRSDSDDVNANESELALIKFPVDELFTTELPTFDAVILKDQTLSRIGCCATCRTFFATSRVAGW